MHYIGIDLAWGARNTTAVVVLEGTGDPRNGARLIDMSEALQSNDDILGFVESHIGGPDAGVIVTIDAPAIVTNVTGRRPCEAILSSALAKFQAGPHPANLTLRGGTNGVVRGVRIADMLAESGIPQTPYLITLTRPIRACFEVFPHPAHVALFGLDKTLKYKAKPNRPLADRLVVYRRYVSLLESLSKFDPPLLINTQEESAEECWLRRDPATLASAPLKRHEDALDALTCAYVGLYHHRWGGERSRIVGDMDTGYIVMPTSPLMDQRLSVAEAKLSIRPIGGAASQ